MIQCRSCHSAYNLPYLEQGKKERNIAKQYVRMSSLFSGTVVCTYCWTYIMLRHVNHIIHCLFAKCTISYSLFVFFHTLKTERSIYFWFSMKCFWIIRSIYSFFLRKQLIGIFSEVLK